LEPGGEYHLIERKWKNKLGQIKTRKAN
jgi:hypothetical protein